MMIRRPIMISLVLILALTVLAVGCAKPHEKVINNNQKSTSDTLEKDTTDLSQNNSNLGSSNNQENSEAVSENSQEASTEVNDDSIETSQDVNEKNKDSKEGDKETTSPVNSGNQEVAISEEELELIEEILNNIDISEELDVNFDISSELNVFEGSE